MAEPCKSSCVSMPGQSSASMRPPISAPASCASALSITFMRFLPMRVCLARLCPARAAHALRVLLRNSLRRRNFGNAILKLRLSRFDLLAERNEIDLGLANFLEQFRFLFLDVMRHVFLQHA